jgi:hypothetical protein
LAKLLAKFLEVNFVVKNSSHVLKHIGQILVAAFALLGPTQSRAYDPGYPFNQYRPVGFKNSECFEDLPGSLYTTGKIQYSCRVTALAHINSSGSPKEEFVALACGRGDTDQFARHSAWARAMSTIKDLEIARQNAKKKAGLIDENNYYVSDGMVDHCVGVPTTRVRETVQQEGEPAIMAPLSESPRLAVTPPAGEAEGGNESTPLEAEGGNDPSPEPDPNTATFIIHSKSPYRVGIEFYSQDRNHAWPGGNRQYTINDDGTYNLTCNVGEKICFGAWRDGNDSVYWGTGMNDSHNCQRCCITCGNTFETNLIDNGGSGGGSSGVIDSLGAILNGAAGALGNRGGSSGSTVTGGNSVRVPVPSGNRQGSSNSTITGH